MIERVHSQADIRSFMVNPEVWNKISQDGHNPDDFGIDETAGWLAYKVNDKVVGMFCFDECQGPMARFHPYMLSEYKMEHAYKACREAIKYAFDEVGVLKLVAQVPFLYKEVYNFGLKLGFIEEGVNRKSFLKNGKIYDQWHLGMMQGELK